MKDLIHAISPLIPALRRYARMLLRDREQADDAVQDCLERVVRSWQQRKGDQHTRQWIFAILHNHAMDKLRQRLRLAEHISQEPLDDDAIGVSFQQEAHMRYVETMKALQTLSDEHRGILLMVSVEGMSYGDVAQALGIPIGTVMSRLSRARERLRQALDTNGEAKPVGEPRSAAIRRVK